MTPIEGPKGPRTTSVPTTTSLLRRADGLAPRLSIPDILSHSTKIEATIRVSDRDTGRAQTRDLFGGKTVVGFQGFRTEREDLLVFELEGNELAVARFNSGHIIALECTPAGEKRTIVGFRENVAHSRMCIALSVANRGQTVAYLDPATIAGAEVLHLSGEVTGIGLAKPLPISNLEPSWWTEDWLTVKFMDGSTLVIRADAGHMRALQRHKIGGTTVLVFGPTAEALPPLPNGNLPLLPIVKK